MSLTIRTLLVAMTLAAATFGQFAKAENGIQQIVFIFQWVNNGMGLNPNGALIVGNPAPGNGPGQAPVQPVGVAQGVQAAQQNPNAGVAIAVQQPGGGFQVNEVRPAQPPPNPQPQPQPSGNGVVAARTGGGLLAMAGPFILPAVLAAAAAAIVCVGLEDGDNEGFCTSSVLDGGYALGLNNYDIIDGIDGASDWVDRQINGIAGLFN